MSAPNNLFSRIQPTGTVHLGDYSGAIKIRFYAALTEPLKETIIGSMMAPNITTINDIILTDFPRVQAIFLFGSGLSTLQYPMSDSTDGSDPGRTGYTGAAPADIDIALLLPVEEAREQGGLFFSDTRTKLEDICLLPVDLVNLRLVSVVFKHEIIQSGERIYTGDVTEADTFEMLTISFYQKLNQERKEVLHDFFKTKRAYRV